MRSRAASIVLITFGFLSACRHVDDAPTPEGETAPPRSSSGTAEDVPGPDGETAHVVSAGSPASCYKKAAELCPEGYVVRSNVVQGPWLQWKLVVSCKRARSGREDERVCEAAYPHASGFATYWAGRTGSKRLEEQPPERDFVITCKEMPERVQRCMHELYRESHAGACEALLSRLEATTRAKIDGLFLEATTPVPPAVPAPGVTPRSLP